MADAVHWAAATGADLQFVTQACELVAPDGTLLLGPRQSATGLISRRAELRALRGQLADLAAKIERGQAEVTALEDQVAAGDKQAGRLETEHRELSRRLASQRLEAVRPKNAAFNFSGKPLARQRNWQRQPTSTLLPRPHWPRHALGWRKMRQQSAFSKAGCVPTSPALPSSNKCATAGVERRAAQGLKSPAANSNSIICEPSKRNSSAISKSAPRH